MSDFNFSIKHPSLLSLSPTSFRFHLFVFLGTGATLVFDEGETEATIAIIILADDIPEVDETLVVSLSNPMGGASIASGDEGRTTVIIEANDAVAGVVGLSPLSRSAVVGEGESDEFELVRSVGTMGVVEVDWEITGTGNPSLEFVTTQATATFAEVGISYECACMLCACMLCACMCIV